MDLQRIQKNVITESNIRSWMDLTQTSVRSPIRDGYARGIPTIPAGRSVWKPLRIRESSTVSVEPMSRNARRYAPRGVATPHRSIDPSLVIRAVGGGRFLSSAVFLHVADRYPCRRWGSHGRACGVGSYREIRQGSAPPGLRRRRRSRHHAVLRTLSIVLDGDPFSIVARPRWMP